VEIVLVSKSTLQFTNIIDTMNIKFNPLSGIETSVNVNKISPKLMMIIGSLLLAYGLYKYLNKENKEINR
jgi:hypothetical protein